jgi:hypothetical protein
VKIVRNTLGVPMSESEFLSTPVVVTDKKETQEKTTKGGLKKECIPGRKTKRSSSKGVLTNL